MVTGGGITTAVVTACMILIELQQEMWHCGMHVLCRVSAKDSARTPSYAAECLLRTRHRPKVCWPKDCCRASGKDSATVEGLLQSVC